MPTELDTLSVSASTQVIDPASFRQRIARAVTEIRAASGNGSDWERNRNNSVRERASYISGAELVRAQVAGVERPTGIAHPGWRGAASARLKAQIRRLIYWYVDPVFDLQQANARLISEQIVVQAETIGDLRREITELQGSLADLRQISARLQRTSQAAALCAGAEKPPPTGKHELTSERS